MKKTFFDLVFCTMCLLFLCFVIVSCNNESTENKTTQYASSVTEDSCNCEPYWFPHNQTPAPAEGDGSPFDVSSTSNGIFHQWSWQKFLWLTKPLSSGNPLFIDSLKQVNKYMEDVKPLNGISLVLDDSLQAGGKKVILTTNATYGEDKKSHTVYYSIFVNDILGNTSKQMKALITKNSDLVNNNFVFPVGALELKISWVDINSLPANEVQNYYTRKAIIMPFKKQVTVALLGMHVVGVVKNHPEFIWATFEHKNMAPNYDWNATTSQDVSVSSNTNMLFFQKGISASYKNLIYDSTKLGNQNVFTVYQRGVPKLAGDKYMAVSQSEPINDENIIRLNSCVNEGLNDIWQNYFYNGSIWINTDGLSSTTQADTIVALGYNIGNAMPGSIARGSLGAFNITMETFQQAHQELTSMNANSLTNCLSCHGATANISISGKSGQFNSPLYLSHIFRSYLNGDPNTTKSQIDVLRNKDIMDLIKIHKEKIK